MNQVYELGINWIFPYKVLHQDSEIMLLEELPRVHKRDFVRSNEVCVDLRRDGSVWLDGKEILYEILR